jgi:hypothetical protein
MIPHNHINRYALIILIISILLPMSADAATLWIDTAESGTPSSNNWVNNTRMSYVTAPSVMGSNYLGNSSLKGILVSPMVTPGTVVNPGDNSAQANYNTSFHVKYVKNGTGTITNATYWGNGDASGNCWGNGRGYCFFIDPTASTTNFRYTLGGAGFDTGVAFQNNTWYEFRAQVVGSTITLYINSTQVGTGTLTNAGSADSNYTLMGWNGITGHYVIYFDNVQTCTGECSAIPQTFPLVNVSLQNAVNGSLWPSTVSFSNVTGNLTFSYFNITGLGFCVTYTGNGTGTNCTTNNGTSTYFNVTNTTVISGTQDVVSSSYAALLNISAQRLFLNNSINNFNVTNYVAFNSTTNGNLLIPANNGGNNLQAQVLGNYSQNQTCTGTSLTTTSCIINDIYDDLYTIGAKTAAGVSVNTFRTIVTNTTLSSDALYNQTTTNGSIVFPVLQGYYYLFNIEPSGYAHANTTQAANASTNLYNFTLYIANVFNITFYDEQTNTTITTANITFDVIPNSTPGSTYFTTNGTLQTTILSPDDYTFRYYGTNATGGANYSTRFWYITLLNNTNVVLRLPLLKTSVAQAVTVTTVTSTSIPIPDLIIKAYKYDPFTGVYVLNQMVKTNTEGQGVFSLQLANEFYYFTIENDEEVLLITEPSYIYSNTIEPFVIDLLPGGFNNFFDAAHLAGSITFTNATRTATFTYIDSDNTATQGCLYAYAYNVTGKLLYNQSCISSSSGTIQLTIPGTGNWQFQGYVTKNDINNLLAAYSQNYGAPPEGENTHMMGLFTLFIIIIVFVFILRKYPPVMVAIIGVLPLLFSIIEFISIGVEYTLPIAILGFGLALFLGRSQPST